MKFHQRLSVELAHSMSIKKGYCQGLFLCINKKSVLDGATLVVQYPVIRKQAQRPSCSLLCALDQTIKLTVLKCFTALLGPNSHSWRWKGKTRYRAVVGHSLIGRQPADTAQQPPWPPFERKLWLSFKVCQDPLAYIPTSSDDPQVPKLRRVHLPEVKTARHEAWFITSARPNIPNRKSLVNV